MKAIARLFKTLFALILAVVVVVLCYLGAFALLGLSSEYPFAERGVIPGKGVVAGAYHVHTTASDGRGTLEHVVAAALRAHLQFVILTDHNTVIDPHPRFIGTVLVIPGIELSTASGHLVSLPNVTVSAGAAPIEGVHRAGASAYLAHPVQRRMPWTDWQAAHDADGLELYSADTMLREAQRSPMSRLLPAIGAWATNPAHALFTMVAPQDGTTARLLEISTKRPKVALCSVDAHGIPGYDEVFRSLAIEVPREAPLPLDAESAQREILSAIHDGAAFCVFRALGDGAGFSIQGLPASRRAPVGTKLKMVLPPEAPAESRIMITGAARVLQDGRTVELDRPGPVQIEVWRRTPGTVLGSEWKPWIVPSPILIE